MGEKPVLSVRTETINRVEDNTLDLYIKEVTGHQYNCVGTNEWGNDSEHRFTVHPFKSDYDRLYNLPDWEGFKLSGKKRNSVRQPHLQVILDGLCTDGYIPAGIYLVTVCW